MSNRKSGNKGFLPSNYIVWILAVMLLVVVVAAVIGIITSSGQSPAPTEPSQNSEQSTDQPTETTQLPTESESSTEEVTEPVTQPTEETTAPTAPTIAPTLPRPTTPPKVVIKLPYTIPGTNLVVQRVANYSGIYLEDGSNSEVTDVAMMLLYNAGNEAIEFADCKLVYDDKTLEFKVSGIPAGAKVAVQEIHGQSSASGDLTQCTAEIATLAVMEMSSEQVLVVDNGDNSLTVTNLTEQTIPTVRIFYKYYLTEEDAFIGGIAFSAPVHELKAGESVVLMPKHYSSNGSRVIMVRTYDTAA